MNRYRVTAVIALTLAGCTQLSAEDRSLLMEAHSMAQEAKNASMQAAEEARLSREVASRSAVEAKAASDRADRLFRQAQNR